MFSLACKPQNEFFGKINYNSRARKPQFPKLDCSRLIRDVLRVFAQAADSQDGAYSEFVCTGQYLAEEYGCSQKHTTYLFRKAIESGLVVVTQDFKYINGTYRKFQFIPTVAAKIDLYLSDFLPPPKNVAVVPTIDFDEIQLASPVFSGSGMSFEEENETLVSLTSIVYPEISVAPPEPKPRKPILNTARKRKSQCEPDSYALALSFVDDYLGFFEEFKEKQAFCRRIGLLFERDGIDKVDSVFLYLPQKGRNTR